MAKGQKRSNRELKKPKQKKAPAVKLETSLGSQVQQVSNNFPRGKVKG